MSGHVYVLLTCMYLARNKKSERSCIRFIDVHVSSKEQVK